MRARRPEPRLPAARRRPSSRPRRRTQQAAAQQQTAAANQAAAQSAAAAQQAATAANQAAAAAAQAGRARPEDDAAKARRVQALYKQGLITESEYNARRPRSWPRAYSRKSVDPHDECFMSPGVPNRRCEGAPRPAARREIGRPGRLTAPSFRSQCRRTSGNEKERAMKRSRRASSSSSACSAAACWEWRCVARCRSTTAALS